MSVRVRFAPSPTGFIHAGNVRAAIVTWLFARKNDGHFLLRIDDTDIGRCKPEYEEDVESSLMWLGLAWDEKAKQSLRGARYDAVIEQLKKDGRLYACYETPEELALKRKTQLSRGLPPLYDRAALKLSAEQKTKYESEGRKPHWRFLLRDTAIEWDDIIRGPVRFEAGSMSDPVLIREDGTPLYHLCSVIDDIDYDITHVVRGEDHVSNTAMHIQMFEAIGRTPPSFAHLPMITDSEGGKLSKRLGSLSIRDLRDTEKLEPMAIVSLLARLGSSDPIAPFTGLDDLVSQFDLSKFSKGAPKFDMEELLRLNARIIHETDFDSVNVRLANMGIPDLDENFWTGVRANLTRLEDIREWWRVANGPVEAVIDDPDFIAAAAAALPAEPWTGTTWKEWTDKVKDGTGRKGKDLFMPLRRALTGMDHGPEMAVLLPLIGPAKVRDRLKTQRRAA